MWDVVDCFNPRYDATASAAGLRYGCDIQGPFCGYDHEGTQSWDEFLASGPLPHIRMPDLIAAEIRAYALERGYGQAAPGSVTAPIGPRGE